MARWIGEATGELPASPGAVAVGVATLISANGAPDALYRHVREHFSEKEQVDLALAIFLPGWPLRWRGRASLQGEA